MKILFFLLISLVTQNVFASISTNLPKICQPAVEYTTTFNYLKSKTDFEVSQNQAAKIANEVSKGCTGASQRFIDVTNYLSHAGLTGDDAIKTGLQFVNESEITTNNFLKIFKMAFLRKYLDMDLHNSLKLARSLSLEYLGENERIGQEFETMVEFCTDTENLSLPGTQCASFTAEVLQSEGEFGPYAAKDFIKVFHFLRDDEKGPKRSTAEALKKAKEVVAFGPSAADNYITGYSFAVAKSGLKKNESEAMVFAAKLASRSVMKESQADKGKTK